MQVLFSLGVSLGSAICRDLALLININKVNFMTITNPSLASSSVCEATNEILLTQSQDISTNTNSVSIIPTALKYDREKLKRSLSFHVTGLFEKALE